MNKTTRYLYAFYSNFGDQFKNIYNSQLKVLQLYLGDRNYRHYENFTKMQDFLEDSVMLVEVDNRSLSFEKSINAIRNHERYVTDYASEQNRHIIVLEVTDEHKRALRNFKLSRYSRMYNSIELEKVFANHSDYLAKYGMADDLVTKDNCERLIGEHFNYHQFKLSPYHVTKRSNELRELLECVYNCHIDDSTELMEKIRLNKEILNYEQHAAGS